MFRHFALTLDLGQLGFRVEQQGFHPGHVQGRGDGTFELGFDQVQGLPIEVDGLLVDRCLGVEGPEREVVRGDFRLQAEAG